MDEAQQNSIHQAMAMVQCAIHGMSLPGCDQGDLMELVDGIEEQLQREHPSLATLCTFLNSIARSLRTQPEAREACLAIERAIQQCGMPSTWQSGI